MTILIGILLFALLVVVHEFGHFIVARRNGVEVEEFGIGFPPRLLGKRVGPTLYSFNLIPLGGFVKLKGESNEDTEPGGFGASSLWVKSKILLAGVAMNILACFVIVLVLAFTGLPQIIPNQYRVPGNEYIVSDSVVVAHVQEDSAAATAGIENGDKLLYINDLEIGSAEGLSQTTSALAGQEVRVGVDRQGETSEIILKLGDGGDTGYLGVAPLDLSTSRYTWAAPLVAIGVTLQMIGLVIAVLASIFFGLITGAAGEATEQLTGPVGIVFLLQNLGDFGWEYLYFLLASISISLAVFNALPIPALDGGRLAVIAVARGLRKKLSAKVESAVHGFGFVLLIGLLIAITYVDIQRFF